MYAIHKNRSNLRKKILNSYWFNHACCANVISILMWFYNIHATHSTKPFHCQKLHIKPYSRWVFVVKWQTSHRQRLPTIPARNAPGRGLRCDEQKEAHLSSAVHLPTFDYFPRLPDSSGAGAFQLIYGFWVCTPCYAASQSVEHKMKL